MPSNSSRIVSQSRDAATGVVELRLSNGLHALVLSLPDSPVVSVQAWYRVGSREEEKGRTGLAHFLEHLMFKGTATMRKGDIDLVTLRNGGQNNADTTYDRTRYYFSFARDRWERGLEIEADRMRGSAFDEHEFQAERGPVLEELRRDRDDPWWRLYEAMDSSAYHVHPYQNPVIGWAEEVTKVPREDVLSFYDRWYQPGNCTVVIAGGMDADAAAARIVELFGPIAGGPIAELPVPAEPVQEGERRFELELELQLPRMLAAFHGVRASDVEDPILDVIQGLLSAGKSSRLYDRLIRRDSLCAQISASNDARRDPGLFYVACELQPGADRAHTEAAIWEELDRLGRDGPTVEELERVKTMTRAGMVYRRMTASGTAEMLGSMQIHAGNWRLAFSIEERIAAVTAEDVMRVIRTTLRRSNRTVGWALPRPADAAPKQSLPDGEVHDAIVADADDDSNDDAADAPLVGDARPEPDIARRLPTGTARTVELPVKRIVLPNGLRVLLLRRGGAPVISVRAYIDAGMLREAQPGLSVFTGDVLDEGAAGRAGTDISKFIENRGASMSIGGSGGSLRCLVSDAAACLDVFADVLLRPDFPAEAVERKRGELIADLLAEDDDPSFVGRERARAEIYGSHPYARRDKGGEAALRALTRDDLVAHHRTWFVPRNAIVSVVGDLPEAEMEALIRARFGSWEDRPVPPLAFAAPPENAPGRDVRVEMDREQLHIYLGHLGIRRTDPDYHALLLGDLVLGSGPGFTDRVSKRLRDELGLAYTVYARIARGSDLEPGSFMAYIGTSPKSRDAAIDGMRAEIRRFVAEGPTDAEIADAKSYLLGSYVFGFETPDITAEHIVQLERLGLGFGYPAEFARIVGAITPADVAAAVRRHIFPDRFITVMVGRTEA
ncbi:MAG: insulinase family protein [Planctomycetes bacterium]|nr:insulinase family protein [Planctomycetota bacterium]